jgi:hypothetical protein
VDKQAIAERLYLYARGWDRRQPSLIFDTFHSDATVQQGDFSGAAHDLMKQWIEACKPSTAMTHLICNILTQLEGHSAISEAHFLAHHRRLASATRAEHDWFIKGRYLDRFERRDDGIWRVANRIIVLDFECIVEPSDADLAALPPKARGQFYPQDALFALLDSAK